MPAALTRHRPQARRVTHTHLICGHRGGSRARRCLLWRSGPRPKCVARRMPPERRARPALRRAGERGSERQCLSVVLCLAPGNSRRRRGARVAVDDE
eukprot:6968331-Prymnesium_polylepis.1